MKDDIIDEGMMIMTVLMKVYLLPLDQNKDNNDYHNKARKMVRWKQVTLTADGGGGLCRRWWGFGNQGLQVPKPRPLSRRGRFFPAYGTQLIS
ncbi:hypothetical protein HPP92_016207 [Vanilla planifolia]|uniref:Uncharacterized protein n=1 Tax=Vanilla planifolia TaxID=51239 RepID=A0A835QIQ3_VANPL|nr:hypothetical protein HPP92_016207 [Vanilla planifolia]